MGLKKLTIVTNFNVVKAQVDLNVVACYSFSSCLKDTTQ